MYLKQFSVGTKMRPSEIFFGDVTDDSRDGSDLRSPESLKAVFTRSPTFPVPDLLERISDFLRECVIDRPTDRPTDGLTKSHIEMLGRIHQAFQRDFSRFMQLFR